MSVRDVRVRAAPAEQGPAKRLLLHPHAVDDHSRFVYSEILALRPRKPLQPAYMRNAIDVFTAHSVNIQRVLIDNGSCYRPQTNGKVERVNRVLLVEWAYAQAYISEAARQACYPNFIEHYNRSRPHAALKGASPASRVTNQPNYYS